VPITRSTWHEHRKLLCRRHPCCVVSNGDCKIPTADQREFFDAEAKTSSRSW
jgi:hypothetical protein